MYDAELVLVSRLEISTFLDDELGEHRCFVNCLAKVEEDKMQCRVSILIGHIDIYRETTIRLTGLHEVSLDYFAGQLELSLCQCHMHWQTILDAVDARFGLM